MDERRLSRRASLASLGELVVGAARPCGCARPRRPVPGPQESRRGLSSACVLAPEQTEEKPYYVDDAALRRDVREGRPGVALTLRLTVVNASSCKPIKGAAVEIWHCDAVACTRRRACGTRRTSDSSAASSEPTRRASRSSGRSTPGWYQGRTVHIHTMVHIGGGVVHTGSSTSPTP